MEGFNIVLPVEFEFHYVNQVSCVAKFQVDVSRNGFYQQVQLVELSFLAHLLDALTSEKHFDYYGLCKLNYEIQ